MQLQDQEILKSKVKEHWEAETCGTRYGEENDRREYFEQISAARYTLEPYIIPFVEFPRARGKKVLEIGVGAGADFEQWCKYAAHAQGVDLTEAAIQLTEERLRLGAVPSDRFSLQTADAESLPFADNVFDIVYSWGVLHHTPNTEQAFREAWRVLRPGGNLKAMIYHTPSLTGWLLYLQHAVLRAKFGRSPRDIIFSHLESPGTKVYSVEAARQLLARAGFTGARITTRLSPGDLLTIKPSSKYRSPIYTLLWKVYPRWLVRRIGDRYGLALLIDAEKPLG